MKKRKRKKKGAREREKERDRERGLRCEQRGLDVRPRGINSFATGRGGERERGGGVRGKRLSRKASKTEGRRKKTKSTTRSSLSLYLFSLSLSFLSLSQAEGKKNRGQLANEEPKRVNKRKHARFFSASIFSKASERQGRRKKITSERTEDKSASLTLCSLSLASGEEEEEWTQRVNSKNETLDFFCFFLLSLFFDFSLFFSSLPKPTQKNTQKVSKTTFLLFLPPTPGTSSRSSRTRSSATAWRTPRPRGPARR